MIPVCLCLALAAASIMRVLQRRQGHGLRRVTGQDEWVGKVGVGTELDRPQHHRQAKRKTQPQREAAI